VGLVEFETMKLWPCTLPFLSSKFIAIYNMRGQVNLAYTNPKILKRVELEKKREEMKKNWEENKNKINNIEEDENAENTFNADNLVEFQELDNELTNDELSVRVAHEKLRIYEGDIITI